MKVAIVHDWLTNLGGAERLVLELMEMYPEADLFTSVSSQKRLKIFRDYTIHTSFLQHWPLSTRHQLYPVLRRLAFESFDFSSYDLVITSTSAEAKGVITGEHTAHLCYMNTPTRYYWSHYDEYLQSPGFGWLNPVVRLALRSTIRSSRHWDYAAAQRPDLVLANSQTIQKRVKKYYDRESDVVYPAVDTKRFLRPHQKPSDAPESYLVVVSRLIPYKRIDIAVAAAQAAHKELVVIGGGSQMDSLKKMSNSSVHFKGELSDEEVVAYMQHAEAFLFPGLEDFGIAPVEAMAAGIPVIAYGEGGASETVLDKKTGILVPHQSVRAFTLAIQQLQKFQFDQRVIRARAEEFSSQHFRNALMEAVKKVLTLRGSRLT